MATDPPADRLSIPADLERLVDAREWTRGHAELSGFEGHALTEIELAVTEAVSNVIRHGLRLDPDQVVTLEATGDAGSLEIVVTDRGPAFDPRTNPEPDLSEPRAGGYGTYLIRTVMDEVRWQHRNGKNRLTLVRRNGAEAQR